MSSSTTGPVDFSALLTWIANKVAVILGIPVPTPTAAEAALGITPTSYYYSASPYDARRYGVDTSGTSNTTAQLLNFYRVCHYAGEPGYVPAGTYRVTPGQLTFDNGFVDKPMPMIYTAGAFAVNYLVDYATEVNSPVLQWKNGTANSTVGKYWRGGGHGGITITGSQTGGAMAAQHHFDLTGLWGTKFGYMRSNYCKGNAFNIPVNLYAGNNPDPYACSFVDVDLLEANFATGYGFCNNNWVGMDSWLVHHIRIIGCAAGGWYGIGSGCVLDDWSCASCTGWAFDDGTQVAITGGRPQRNYMRTLELDGNQNGVRIGGGTRMKIIGCRQNSRWQSALSQYWPITQFDIGGGAVGAPQEIEIDTYNRIDSGGSIAQWGTFLKCNSASISGLSVTFNYADGGLTGGVFGPANFVPTNPTAASAITVKHALYGTAIYDVRDQVKILARGSASTTVPNTGGSTWPTTGTKLTGFSALYNTVISATSWWDTTNNQFTAPRAGIYRVTVTLPLALTTAGTSWVKLAPIVNGALYGQTHIMYAPVSAQTMHYQATFDVSLARGDVMYIAGQQNTASSPLACSPIGNNDEVRIAITEGAV